MEAVIQVFKRVNGFPEDGDDDAASIPFCSLRLLVSSNQGMSLIGKQGSSIKTIQETGCSVRVHSSGIYRILNRIILYDDDQIKSVYFA